jgi:SAM-dependent methyltransferase
VIHRARNFFGALRVLYDPAARVHRLLHGSTLHGQQSLEPSRRAEPSTYFTRSGPIGGLFDALGPALGRPGARVAIVGLGTGTLACYAKPGQAWTFYEIDDAVVQVAEDARYFSYLADARARGVAVGVVEGDARLRIGEAPDGGYGLIVLDAFSSDAVPVHLLSREAIALYRRKLGPGGVLAFNLSNRYLDLDPLMDRQARDAGLACRIRHDLGVSPEERRDGKQPSIWCVMAESEADLHGLADDPRWRRPRHRPGSSAWTDDYSDLASYLVFKPRWADGRGE